MDSVATNRQAQLGNYLLLGVLLAALAASFFEGWDYSSNWWFRIGTRAADNTSYSPGPLIPIMVLLMMSKRLRDIRDGSGTPKQDWFKTAFETVLWPVVTKIVEAWHRLRNISSTPEARREQAYKYRAYAVWAVWGLLAAGLAASLHYRSEVPILSSVGDVLLFVHVIVLSAAVFYVAWRIFHSNEQMRAAASGRASQVTGCALLVFFLIVHFAAVRGELYRLSVMSFLGCLLALLWFFYGWRVARIFIFPLAFMVFTLPMEWIEDRFGLPAQMFATKNSVNIMGFLGVNVNMIGKTSFEILKGGTSIDFSVDAPCSGLKSLVALTAISATYGYMTQKTLPKMIVIMACGPLIAVLTNIIRLVAVGVVAQSWGRSLAMAVHDHALPIYILGILLLIAIDKLINSKWLKIEDF
jgi:exosortase